MGYQNTIYNSINQWRTVINYHIFLYLIYQIRIGNLLFTTLCNVEKYDKFICGGKRLTLFDNQALTKTMQSANEEIHAIHADFNYYYQTIVVLTK